MDKLVEYLSGFTGEDTPLEVRRFVKDLLIKIEFGEFEEDEDSNYFDHID